MSDDEQIDGWLDLTDSESRSSLLVPVRTAKIDSLSVSGKAADGGAAA